MLTENPNETDVQISDETRRTGLFVIRLETCFLPPEDLVGNESKDRLEAMRMACFELWFGAYGTGKALVEARDGFEFSCARAVRRAERLTGRDFSDSAGHFLDVGRATLLFGFGRAVPERFGQKVSASCRIGFDTDRVHFLHEHLSLMDSEQKARVLADEIFEAVTEGFSYDNPDVSVARPVIVRHEPTKRKAGIPNGSVFTTSSGTLPTESEWNGLMAMISAAVDEEAMLSSCPETEAPVRTTARKPSV